MVTLTFSIAVVVLTAFIIYYTQKQFNKRRSKANFPSGPFAWPIVGNLFLFAGKDRLTKIGDIGRKYSGIYRLQIGQQEFVFVTSYKYFREAVITNSWTFSGRPRELRVGSDEGSSQFPGIVASGVDEDEKEIRKFVLVGLRSFGFGKTSMQDSILQESEYLIEEFRKTNCRPFEPRNILSNAAANVISAIMLGKTFPHGDPEFQKLSTGLTEGVKATFNVQRDLAFPILKWLPTKSKNDYFASFRNGVDFLRSLVLEHLKTHRSQLPRDFIDIWLDQSMKGERYKNVFNTDKLPQTMLDLFIGGFETTTTTFQWIFAMLLHHPHVQVEIHKELDQVVGRGNPITLDHRDELVYTESVILETLRLYPLIPFAVPHTAIEDATLGPYKLPSGTRLILFLWSIHHDPELWDKPEVFKPERFIKNRQICIPDYFVPFSAGRRSCIGEQLARKELFLFFVNIMQNFTLVKDPSSDFPSLEVKQGVVIYPESFKIVANPR